MGFLKHFRPCADDCAECKPNPCDSCCPGFTVEYRTRSATKTKCGFAEFGTPGTPPLIYRTKTQSGGLTDSIDAGTADEETYQNTYSGALEYNRPACDTTDTRQLAMTYISGANNNNCTGNKTVTGANSWVDTDLGSGVFVGTQLWGTDCAGTSADQLQGCDSEVIVTSAQKTYATTSCSPAYTGGAVSGGTVTLTLSNEYTTSQLLSDTETALAAAGWSAWGTTPTSALYDVSTDELTITLRDLQCRVVYDHAAPSGCKLEFDLYHDGAFVTHYCYPLTPGSTDSTGIVSIAVNHPVDGPGNYTFENFAITDGSCV